MKRLVYVSEQKQEISATEIEEIIDNAVKNNHNNDITGVLIHISGVFMQYLEGKGSDVDALMTKIKKDQRHHKIRIIFEDYVYDNPRLFHHWSMLFKEIDFDGGTNELIVDKIKEWTKTAFLEVESGENLEEKSRVLEVMHAVALENNLSPHSFASEA